MSGILTQLLMLPSATHTNMGAAYAAVLTQARLVHEDLTGNSGPTLVPAAPVCTGGSMGPAVAARVRAHAQAMAPLRRCVRVPS